MKFQQNPLVESAPLLEELMLFHPQGNKFCVLNHTASFIWTSLAQPSTAEHLAHAMCQHFADVAPADALRDVQEALQMMCSLELVVVQSASTTEELQYGKSQSAAS